MTDQTKTHGHVEHESSETGEEKARLDTRSSLERRYPDAGPTNAEIERLCDVWAEVGRAILRRRKCHDP